VVTAAICYPPESDLPDELRHGVLIIGKALLTRDMSYDLLSYAARNDVFPHDSTGDQFFTDEMFTAYTALGRHTGQAAGRILDTARDLVPTTCPACGAPLAISDLVTALPYSARRSAQVTTAGTSDGRTHAVRRQDDAQRCHDSAPEQVSQRRWNRPPEILRILTRK
jgi:hypothetical protein